MSFEQFWRNVRAGAGSMGPAVINQIGSPSPSPRVIELDLWLTPAVVDGFDPQDFSFLPPEERETLEKNARAFRQIAEQVPPSSPATEELVKQARPLFESIIQTLRIKEHRDPIEYKVGQILESFKPRLSQVAPWVVAFKMQVDEDSSGEDAIWIWVIVTDEFAKSPEFFTGAEQVRKILEELLSVHGIVQWVHVRFQTVSEQDEEEEETS